MVENELAKIIVNVCYDVHVEFGPGLFESVYEEILFYELNDRGFFVERQKVIPIYWNGIKMEKGFIADIIVDDLLIVEVKSVETLKKVHYKQLLTYLRLTDIKLGLLVNFNESLIKNGIKRIVNKL